MTQKPHSLLRVTHIKSSQWKRITFSLLFHIRVFGWRLRFSVRKVWKAENNAEVATWGHFTFYFRWKWKHTGEILLELCFLKGNHNTTSIPAVAVVATLAPFLLLVQCHIRQRQSCGRSMMMSQGPPVPPAQNHELGPPTQDQLRRLLHSEHAQAGAEVSAAISRSDQAIRHELTHTHTHRKVCVWVVSHEGD